jgi:hypothetical protein
VRFDEGVRISLVRDNVDLCGIEVVQVHRPNDILGYPGGQRDRDPITFTVLGAPRSLTPEVSRMGEVTPGLVFEALPLLE